MAKFDWAKLQGALQFYEREHLRYIPLTWGSKRPPGLPWKTFQERAPSFSELAEWFQETKPVNIGIICGGASMGLVALCFNDTTGAVEFFGQELFDRLLTSTFVVKTSRGVHVYLRSNIPIPSQFVAKGSNLTWLEIRADGQYIAAPPSLHPSGSFYEPIGIEAIASPTNLSAFIEQRLSHLGLKTQSATETPKGKPSRLEEGIGTEQSAAFNEVAIKKLLENCAFIQYCQDNAATLSEPYWWSMTHNVAAFGEPGREKTHELSKPYPKYTEAETEAKIKDAQKAIGKEVSPHSCAFIEQELGFSCPDDCLAKGMGIKSPAGLAHALTTQEKYGSYLYRDKSGWHLDITKLVSNLLAEYSFKTLKDNEECLVYRNGVYAPLAEIVIKEECEKRVPKKFMSTHNVNEIIGHIKRSTYIERSSFNQAKWILNLENGLYDIWHGKLEPHNPEFLSTIRIPVIYENQAECPQVSQFFSQVLKKQDVPVLEELFGYCLIPDYQIQRAFLFTGDGANGKSVMIELFKAFLGTDNCANLPLQTLENHRFALSNLFGKLANLYADIPSTPMRHVGVFKMLTGGDTMGAEKKYQDTFSFNNHARLIFSSNKPPRVDEDTLAFWRRWLMIDFPNKFEGANQDTGLLGKLTKESELSGLLNLALQGLKRLLSANHYSHEQSSDEIASRYQKASDSLFAFVEDVCQENPDAWISKDDLYTAFIAYCDEENIPRIGKEAFGRAIKNATNVHVTSQRHRIGSMTVYGWGGIQIKTLEEEGERMQEIAENRLDVEI